MDNNGSSMVPQPHGGALKPIKPGEARNPKGRPKGSNFTAILHRALNKRMKALFPGRKLKKEELNALPWELVVKALLLQATKGDIQAIQLIWERVEGKVAGTVEAQSVINVDARQQVNQVLCASPETVQELIAVSRKLYPAAESAKEAPPLNGNGNGTNGTH
jgi:hypothetical protein